jgi:hypothetical protein
MDFKSSQAAAYSNAREFLCVETGGRMRCSAIWGFTRGFQQLDAKKIKDLAYFTAFGCFLIGILVASAGSGLARPLWTPHAQTHCHPIDGDKQSVDTRQPIR